MSTFVGLAAVALATFTVLSYLAFIWWLDRYEREPIWLVALTFCWGAIGGTCFGCALSAPMALLAIEAFGSNAGDIVGTVVIAPFTEEFTKALIFIPLVFSSHFDNETDGLIYGAATGLGFAALENIMYFSGTDSVAALIQLAIIRTLFTALVHCISSAALGMAIGYARHRSGVLKNLVIITFGYLVAVTNHGVWNGVATAAGALEEGGVTVAMIGCFIVACAAVAMFLLTQLSLWREHKAMKKILLAEAARGVIPQAHAAILPYWSKRRKTNWLAPHINRKLYIKLSTHLSFRLHQLEIAKGERRDTYLKDIEQYRQRIRTLLDPNSVSHVSVSEKKL